MQTRQTRLGSKSCYGVDRQGDRIAVILAQRNGGRVICTPVPVGPGAILPATGSIPSVVAIPSGRCLTRWIETPFTSAAKAESVLPALLDVQLPFPLESCHYACVSLEAGKNSSRALTAAVRQTDLDSELKSLSTSGVDPQLMDCEPLALWTQALHELPRPAASLTRAILYLGDDSARMSVGRGEAYLGGHSTRPDDVTQLTRFLALYDSFGKGPLSDSTVSAGAGALEWWLCGPGAEDTHRVDSLRAGLLSATGGSVAILQDPRHFLARAVATRALLPGPLRCNLRMGAAAHPALLSSNRYRAMANAGLSLAAGILLIVTNIGSTLYLNHQASHMDRDFQALAETLAGSPLKGQKGEDALHFVKKALQQKQGELAPFILRAKPSAADILSTILASAHDHHVQIEHLVIDSGTVSFDGACASASDYTAVADAVRRLGCAVSVNESAALPDGRKSFSVIPMTVGAPST